MRRRFLVSTALAAVAVSAGLTVGGGPATAAPTQHGNSASPPTGISAQAATCVPPTGSAKLKADFNGDGKDDTALFYDYGGGNVALFTMTTQDCGAINPPVRRWGGAHWGTGTRFMTTGDFNGDGKDDVALFYDYGYGHVAVWTLIAHANGDGGFAAPVLAWDGPYWGPGTRFVTSGDFNGDGKTDIAIFYVYQASGGHVALFTLTADPAASGGFGPPSLRWDSPTWGAGTRSLVVGDYNGDGKADVALFWDYGGGNVLLFTMTADTNGSGGIAPPVARWGSRYWGTGTKLMAAGNYNGDTKDDIALFYEYGGPHVSLFTLAASGSGDGSFAGPARVWDSPSWGFGTRFMPSGNLAGGGPDTIGLFYDYSGGHVALFTLSPDTTNGGYNAPVMQWNGQYWGGGTRAMAPTSPTCALGQAPAVNPCGP